MLTNEEFQKKLKYINKGISTSTIYNGNKTIMDCSCEYNHSFKTKAYNLIYNKNGCPVCSGRQVNIGFNDMWTTNPKQAELLLDPEDGYKYSQCSEKKVWWKCPCCGEHLYKKISNVNSRGLICNKCSDGISLPNRFMYNILSQLNISFETEYIIEGANYRYDFYIPKHDLIIEMQGKQHYNGWNSNSIKKEVVQLNDKNKRDYALLLGIKNYVQIDAKETTKNYLKESIESSDLSQLFDLSRIDWEACLLDSVKSFVSICADFYNLGLSTQEISNKVSYSCSSVTTWLKTATELGLCNWIPSKGFLEEEKPVICITTNKKYCSISEAARSTKLNPQNISSVCNKNRNYCGINENGNPMVWRFLENFDPNEKFDTIEVNRSTGTKVNQYTLEGIFIKTYNTIALAKKNTGATNIGSCCRKQRKYSGGYKWYYANDPDQPDKTKIITTTISKEVS